MRRSSFFAVDVTLSSDHSGHDLPLPVTSRLRPARSSRVLTVFAAGFLALDGFLLILAGSWARSARLVGWGIVFSAAAAGVVMYWRHHTRRLAELREALEMEAMKLSRFASDLDRTADP